MDIDEVRGAIDNYRVHLQPQEKIIAEAAAATTGSTMLPTTVDATQATSLYAVGAAAPAAVSIAADRSHGLATS
jgi:hypothetical protein